MIIRECNIRQWDIVYCLDFSPKDKEFIVDALLWADAPDSIISRVSEKIDANREDEGFTFSNPLARKSVVGVGATSTGPEFLNSTIHEIFHIVQDIASTDGMSMLGEDVAYLAGSISSGVSDIVCELSCPYCRNL